MSAETMKHMAEKNNKYTYRITWSEEDKEYVGLCVEFPSLSWLADSPESALRGVRKLVQEVVTDMVSNGESRTDWPRVQAMKDEDIDFTDSPELDETFFAEAVTWPGDNDRYWGERALKALENGFIGETKEAKMKGIDQAEALFKEAFSGSREPRSDAYKRGVLAALVYRFAGIRINQNCPYKPGTAEHDAFCAGCDEGHRIWRQHKAKEEGE